MYRGNVDVSQRFFYKIGRRRSAAIYRGEVFSNRHGEVFSNRHGEVFSNRHGEVFSNRDVLKKTTMLPDDVIASRFIAATH